ncbi:hypothetical protein O3M35_012791 [Rhynocoris fuscipes]|uniref:Succinate--CoA ligase [ADP-forming] subunit beta, mitochondrial n=1 Tax=Rhynocoris fuscipes TaxID=488301 RepID=A0AAW1CEU5_9HEMI
MTMKILANSFRVIFKPIIRVQNPLIGGMFQKRYLNIHENLSMKLLHEAGIPVPPFVVVTNKSEAASKARQLNSNELMVKAQVLTGGRGKGSFKGGLKGGVKFVTSPEEAEKLAGQMIGDYLVTVQTGAKGIICNSVMITIAKKLVKEFYVAITMERKYGGPVIIASSQGGVEIEVLSATNPNAITYVGVDIVEGLQQNQAEEVAKSLGASDTKEAANVLMKLYDIFIKKDALLVEVNPFGQDKDGKLWCLDAKLKFDDSADYRQKALHALRDISQEDPREVQATKLGLNYVAMEGNIGCLVNGAGLAMATMDIIKLHGGIPANFLDVGGGANESQVKEAFKIITTDPNVKAIFVNIFGGIMRCDIIARGILMAIGELKLNTPIVVRLLGTNVDEAKKIIAESELKVVSISDFDEASRHAIALANKSM